MSSWRESNAGFWLNGRQFALMWVEMTSVYGSPRVCYEDPSEGWCMTPFASFGRTISVDGTAMARQSSEFFGRCWYSGGGFILFRGLSGWYIVASSAMSSPQREPRHTLDQYGEYSGDEYWENSFDPWAAPGSTYTFYYNGPSANGANKTVTVSAPDLWPLIDPSDGNSLNAPFGRYAGGRWMGAPEWKHGSNRLVFDGSWHGCSESGGTLTLAGGYEAAAPQLGGETVEDIVFQYAGDDGGEHPDITYYWQHYGRPNYLDPEWRVTRYVSEVSLWR